MSRSEQSRQAITTLLLEHIPKSNLPSILPKILPLYLGEQIEQKAALDIVEASVQQIENLPILIFLDELFRCPSEQGFQSRALTGSARRFDELPSCASHTRFLCFCLPCQPAAGSAAVYAGGAAVRQPTAPACIDAAAVRRANCRSVATVEICYPRFETPAFPPVKMSAQAPPSTSGPRPQDRHRTDRSRYLHSKSVSKSAGNTRQLRTCLWRADAQRSGPFTVRCPMQSVPPVHKQGDQDSLLGGLRLKPSANTGAECAEGGLQDGQPVATRTQILSPR